MIGMDARPGNEQLAPALVGANNFREPLGTFS
jgi:hypothetical protein